jgi:hypothetical protein
MNLSIERNDQELAILHEKREINQWKFYMKKGK